MTVTLITGATRGIGLELARRLAGRPDQHVLLGARDLERGRTVAEEIDGRVEAVELDVSRTDTIERLAARLDALDVLVNNAGVELDPEALAIEPDWTAIADTLDVNLLGPWRVTAAMVGLLRRSPHPRIVNVSSSSGLANLVEEGGMGAYRVSKAGLNMLTRIWAFELPGILVNACCPGWVRTDMGGPEAPLRIEDTIDGLVRLATLPDDGPTGRFFRFGSIVSRNATNLAESEWAM